MDALCVRCNLPVLLREPHTSPADCAKALRLFVHRLELTMGIAKERGVTPEQIALWDDSMQTLRARVLQFEGRDRPTDDGLPRR